MSIRQGRYHAQQELRNNARAIDTIRTEPVRTKCCLIDVQLRTTNRVVWKVAVPVAAPHHVTRVLVSPPALMTKVYAGQKSSA